MEGNQEAIALLGGMLKSVAGGKKQQTRGVRQTSLPIAEIAKYR